MTRIKTLVAIALSAVVTSASVASAVDNWGVGKPIPDLPGGNNGGGVVFVPIKVDPPQDKPKVPYIPLDVDFGDNGDPDIPIVLDVPFYEPRPPMDGVPEAAVLQVDCLVRDTEPTTDDLWIVNVGEAELPAGLKIKFSVPSTGDRGAFLLNRSIAVGQKAKASDLLNDAASGAPCRVQII